MKSLRIAIPTSSNKYSTELAAFLLFMFCILLTFNSFAQTNKGLSVVKDYLQENRSELAFTNSDIADLMITDTYTDKHNGVTHIYTQQRLNGISIKHAILGLHLDKNGEVMFVGNRFEKNIQKRAVGKSASIDPIQAVMASAKSLDLQTPTAINILDKSNNTAQRTLLSNGGISQNGIPAELVYYPTENGTLQLAWEVQIYPNDGKNYWVAAVDALSGKMINAQDLVIKCNFTHNHTEENCGAGKIAHQHLNMPSADFNFFSQQENNIRSVFGESSAMAGNFYRVYDAPVESPNHGGRTLVSTDGDPTASPYGWHYDGNVSYNITKGNNVHAYEDHAGVNAGTSPIGGLPGQSLFFDFPVDLTQDPVSYSDAAITNLFFWNNYIHDVMYGYGFTESAGNFQFDNLNNGGIGGDAVMAEAQDGGGTNNANFLTLPDGAPGRMQMYLWTSNAPAEVVHIESSSTYPDGDVSFTGIPAAFGAEITTAAVTAELVMVESNVNTESTCNPCGCGSGQGVGLPPNNNVQGKIVLIDRGDCSFIEKAMGAQMGGAAGVIVANHTPGAGAIAMGGDETGATIVIPCAMVSYEDGLELKDELALGSITVSLKRDEPAPPNKDGDLDNGIIAHEYGHGISTRLTGGPSSTCLSGDEQAGEGWSDFFAMLLTMNPTTIGYIAEEGRGVGSYIMDEPITGGGIRPAKYSTDFGVNDFTYADIGREDILAPHGVGFVFCTMLWEMTWNLIDAYGYDNDITSGDLTKGNVLALQLVMDGLKLQPCSPTFIESRDAILAADIALTGGENQCMIWDAFAKRGLGFSAVSGTNDKGDETEAFDIPPTCLPNVKIVKSAPFQSGNGANMAYTISVENTGSETANSVTVTDPLPNGVNFVNASNGGLLVGNVVTFPTTDLAAGQSIDYTINVTVNTAGTSALAFADNMEDGINQWTTSVGLNSWTYSNAQSRSGNYGWFAADPDNASEQTLELASPVTLSAGSELRFWHKYNTESGFDGGVVELTNDGGLTWYDLGALMTQNGYTDFIPLANNPMVNGFAFGGNSGTWVETVVNLNLYQGQDVNIRFRFSSDVATPAEGWYIDDVVIGNSITAVENTASFVSADGESGSSSVTTLVVPANQSLINPSNGNIPFIEQTSLLDGAIKLIAYPNPARDVVNLKLEGEVIGNAHLNILNSQGQQIMQSFISNEEISPVLSINTSDLPTGMYFIKYQDHLNTKTVKVFISRN